MTSSRRYAILFLGLFALSTSSCAPDVRKMGLSQEIVDHLPREHALSFLQSLGPDLGRNVYCQFEKEGVTRWIPGGKPLRGRYPYDSLYARALAPGVMTVVGIYAPTNNPGWRYEPWCYIATEANADRLGKDSDKFTAKTLTALLSLGVRVPDQGTDPVKPKG